MKKLKPKAILKQHFTEFFTGIPERPALCPHFAECGGCEYQNYPYASQIAAKKAVWERLVATAGLDLPEAEIVESPKEFGYRQRMDYVFAFGAAGLRKRGSHRRIVDLQECPLLGERGFAAFRRAKELALAAGLTYHDYLRHDGFLRYFVVRQPRTGGLMLSLVTYSRGFAENIEQIAETLLREKLATSVYWLVNDTLSDLSFGTVERFWGEEQIKETYLGKTFLIGANTFAQANPDVAEKAYQRIVDANKGEKNVCDAYSGTGAIGELLSPHCEKITAVENVPDNVALAQIHAQINHAANIESVLADAQEFLINTAKETVSAGRENETPNNSIGRFSAIVVNPPRSGIGEKSANALVAIGAPKLTYMSCNPQTLLQDLQILLPAYAPQSVTLFDMFPQTHHWETLCIMRRRD